MSIHRAVWAAAGGCLVLSPPLARSQPVDPQSVVVTAARLPQALATVPQDLRVIDRSQIERAGATGLGELLQRLAGAEFAASGGPGQPSALFLRGSNANHVVLLVDGVRVNSATAGTNALEHLPLAQIDRIEVLLGPASGLYGADAIGGVIQVFTRQDPGVQAQLGLGSERTREASAHVGGRDGGTRWSLQGGWRDTQGISATNADNAYAYNPDLDPYRNANVGANVEHDWAAGQTLALRASVSDSRTHFDSGPDSDDFNDQQLTLLALESRNRLGERWSSTLRLARGSDDSRAHGAYPSRFRTDQDQLSWQNDVRPGVGELAAGLEWRRERVDADTDFRQTERTVASAFGSYALTLGAQQWQAALRHDHNSQFGGRDTGNLGWQMTLAPGLSIRAAGGTAFKAPSFNDLYYPLQYGYQGNPDLRPERSRSVEGGLRWVHGTASLQATVFDNRIDDLIAINDDFSTVENIARARIQGLTLATRWTQGAWSARAEATWQDPRDEDRGAQLARRAKRFGSAGVDWAAGRWRLGAEWVGAGPRPDAGVVLGGYGLITLSAGWTLRPGWTLSARLDNAADKAYTLVQGYNTEGRRVLFTLAFDGT